MIEPSTAFLIGVLVGGGIAAIAAMQGVDHAYRRTREVCETEAKTRIDHLEKQLAEARFGHS